MSIIKYTFCRQTLHGYYINSVDQRSQHKWVSTHANGTTSLSWIQTCTLCLYSSNKHLQDDITNKEFPIECRYSIYLWELIKRNNCLLASF